MHVTCRDLGRFSGMGHACYMHGLVPKFSCMFHAWNVHEKYAYFMHETCMFQAYSMHDTGIFHAWYRHIPCVVQAYSMRGTGVFHSCVRAPCTLQLYRRISLGRVLVYCTCCNLIHKHEALCSCIGKYAH